MYVILDLVKFIIQINNVNLVTFSRSFLCLLVVLVLSVPQFCPDCHTNEAGTMRNTTHSDHNTLK